MSDKPANCTCICRGRANGGCGMQVLVRYMMTCTCCDAHDCPVHYPKEKVVLTQLAGESI